MSELTLHEAIYTTRAMRRLKRDPVSDEDLRYIIDAATQAPTGSNQQGFGFVVVTDPDQKRKLGEVYRELGHKLVKPVSEEGSGANEATRRVYRNAMVLVDHLGEAPALIVVCHAGGHPADPVSGAAYYGSIFPAVQNLMLAARSRGLGTTLTTLHKAAEGRVKEILDIPEDVDTVAMIPVGYPEGKWGRPKRRPSTEITHWNRWQARS